MNELLRKIAGLVHRFSPKWNHAVIWGWPDYEDSVISLEQALQTSRIGKVVILMSDPHVLPPWTTGQKTIRVRKNSIRGWLWFCFAKYVFFTHPCFTRKFPPKVVSVNIWHGMPIKKIGRLIENDPEILSQYTLATSVFWGEIMKKAMSPRSEILSVGLPRNDRLFCNRIEVIEKLGIPSDQRLLVWLPTYRKSVRGLSRLDGEHAGNVFEMPGINPDDLNTFLRTLNVVMLVKPHPMADFDKSKTWSNLLIVDESWLRERSLSLYEFLGATDLLISDISSVVIDYLLLDRPVIHAFADLESYKTSRGFTVEPITDYFAGPVVTNSQELYEALESVVSGHDLAALKRRELLKLSHANMGKGSTARLLNALGVMN